MNALVFTDLASATAQQAQVDAALGYPKAGIDVGGDLHAPAAQSVTTTYFVPIKHPTLAKWAYVVDGVTTPILAGKIGTAVALDATWSTPAAIPNGTPVGGP